MCCMHRKDNTITFMQLMQASRRANFGGLVVVQVRLQHPMIRQAPPLHRT